ncbi:hypothetical protein K2173_009091 [Erythroxylum novogranatense]|uniref:BHLH domain-containing protein n=1 Tax=Erythroxylum novogranatense TaxID=1862640 RepID=A0AAV8TTC7_9ROSI|nr:hypothetical protein K2173_009091 [Erythroxylum novogranatense]
MAQDCTTEVISSSTPSINWWDLHHASSLSPWTNSSTCSPWHQHPNPSSNSSCEDQDASISTSFTNASNQSGLTVDESSRQLVDPAASSAEFVPEHASDCQLWRHLLLGVGGHEELRSNQDVGENLLDVMSSKSNISSGIFEPAYDYLKKMDSNWEFTSSSSSFNTLEKHLNGFNENLIENERLTRLEGNWSIAPPDPEVTRQYFDPLTRNISLTSSLTQFSLPQTYSNSCGMRTSRSSGIFPCYNHDDPKADSQHRDIEVPVTFLPKSVSCNDFGQSVVGDNSKLCCDAQDTTSTSTRKFTDIINFRSRFTKPLIDIQVPKSSFSPLNCRKQSLQASTVTRRSQGTTNETKKKRSEDASDTVLKKPKQETPIVSSVKTQAPKVKLGDRITTLQQIVSPFGKTDTASVLLEAIQYIKFLQEQVQLLSNPSMKRSSHKDPWGCMDRKDKGEVKSDLRSRGLCLVPISCTPQVYHENTGSDYWTPTYRGCLYR